MDENKEKNLDENFDENERLKQELEELAKTFQEELDKAKEEEENRANAMNSSELIQELEDLEEIEEAEEEQAEELTDENRCECCGEKRKGTKKNPDSPYCYECEKALRHYPFELLNLIVPMILVALCCYGVIIFGHNIDVYTSAQLADKYAKQGKLYTANAAYKMAADEMNEANVNGELIYKRLIENSYKAGTTNEDLDATEIFKSWELKLPYMKSIYDIYMESIEMDATQYAIQELFYKYDQEKIEDLDYDGLMAEIDELIEKTATPVPYYDGETEEEIKTTAPFDLKLQNYSKPMILYFKFYVASIYGKDFDTQIKFLEQIKEEYPEKTWLYGALLGDLYNKTGKDITELYDNMKKINNEDTTADVIKAGSLRINGKYDEAIKLCNKFIEKEDAYSYEFLRQKAICFMLQGQNKDAYSAAYSAYEQNAIPLTVNVLMIASIITDNEESYKELEKLYTDSDYTIPQEVIDFKDGKTTVEKIFTKGDFDVA